MKWQLVSDTGSDRLLLIFAGWGMDAGVFAGLGRPGYDVMVVWDYRSFYIDWSCTARYCEICLLAWSLGVYAASQTTHAIDYKITRRVAVNGTPEPIHDRFGIPEATYTGTLEALSERTLAKFYRRMCASREDFERFEAARPSRPVEELKDELRAVADRLLLSVPASARWDVAVVSLDDRIFPPHNQRRAWAAAGVPVEAVRSGHYPDFRSIVSHHFVDKRRMSSRFDAGMATYGTHAAVQTQVIDRLLAMARGAGLIRRLTAEPAQILEIGSGSGILSRRIAELAPKASLTLWDLAAGRPEGLPESVRFVSCDAELQIGALDPESLDFIFSSSTMQWFNSPARFLAGCARALRAGGYALLTTYVRGNMHEISDITGVSLPLLDPDSLLAMASARFAVVDSLRFERDLDFESPVEVLRHLRLTGVDSLGTDNPMRLVRRYPMMLDGRYHLTYRPMILILQKQ